LQWPLCHFPPPSASTGYLPLVTGPQQTPVNWTASLPSPANEYLPLRYIHSSLRSLHTLPGASPPNKYRYASWWNTWSQHSPLTSVLTLFSQLHISPPNFTCIYFLNSTLTATSLSRQTTESRNSGCFHFVIFSIPALRSKHSS
jgi:hypothetical protein